MAYDNEKISYDDPCELEASSIGKSWLPAIDAFITFKEAEKLAPKTVRFYECQSRNLAKRCVARGVRFNEFKASDLCADRDARLAEGIKINTVRHTAVVAKELFAFAKKQKMIRVDPVRDYKNDRPERPIKFVPSENDLACLLETVRDEYRPARNPDARFAPPKLNLFRARRMSAVICVAVDTAARLHEILALRVQDVNWDQKCIQFPKTKNRKAYIHTVPISDDLVDVLCDWLRVRPKSCQSDRLFVCETDGPIAPESLSRLFHKHTIKAGLFGLTFHGLRHYSITAIAVENRLVGQRIAGHASPMTTDLYIHESASDLRDAHAKAAPLARIFRNVRSEAQVASKRRRPKIV